MTINEKQDEIIAEMSDLDDWMDRYAYIIDLGNELSPIAEELKTPPTPYRGMPEPRMGECRTQSRGQNDTDG